MRIQSYNANEKKLTSPKIPHHPNRTAHCVARGRRPGRAERIPPCSPSCPLSAGTLSRSQSEPAYFSYAIAVESPPTLASPSSTIETKVKSKQKTAKLQWLTFLSLSWSASKSRQRRGARGHARQRDRRLARRAEDGECAINIRKHKIAIH